MPVGSQNAADPTLSKTAFTSAEAKTIHELRIVAAINLLEGRGIIAQMEHRRNEVEMTDEVEFNLRVTIPDRVSVDMAGYISSELGEIAMQYKQDWEEPEMVERPTRGEMAFLDEKSGLNFVVEQEYDAYVLKTTCIICGQVFSESLRHYNDREITIGAFRVGYDVGAHLQRHEEFKEIIAAAKKESS